MKKIIIGLCIVVVIQALCIIYMNSAITKCIEVLEQYTNEFSVERFGSS